ncbi:MAG TPA: inositol monophosphatase family protein, partial [Candidatus Acidoferrales bacterium]|nr:inositol monophosphatase family protein [Candidatus Acidoferrales bacterium]
NARPLVERAVKIRILGCMALSIAHTATGGLDAFCSPVRARVFDMSASLLVLREVGGVATDFEGLPLDRLPATLQSRSTLLCAADRQSHELALGLLRLQ